ncbi:hypothetical protein HPB49_003390 [Dermacentor silvarum]|uniref:Uncharacterized protein n=1 Tax=Dermacentor silvarum TaxID=543639 RepID=A0ACB8CPB8_DERSI|nr:hypothetical protein HPB49_003390 [Dermacentor silvarum]
MDSHLLHLWKAKAGLVRMRQLQRWNTTLRRRLTQLNKEIETHVATLFRQNWESLCNRLERNMSLRQTWNLFRHLIHSTQCKTHQKQIMTKFIHAYEASPQELLQTLRGLHFPAYPPGDHPDYTVSPNDHLDKPTTEAARPRQPFHLTHAREPSHPIPSVSKIRILCLILHSRGAHGYTTQALRTQTQQATRLIHCVAHLHAGLRERNTCRLTQAYITSRTAYAFPYVPLKQKERDHINALLRSCTNVALCLSPSTSTARLLNLGTHNTFEELAESTLTAQLTRLSGTATGRTLLCQLGIAPITHSCEAAPLPPDLYSHLAIPPIPKNIHPEHDGKRRAARAKALYKQYGDSSEVAYVDVATYSSGSYMALSLILTQASHWRRLQTGTAPYMVLLHARYPDQFLSSCNLCGKPGDFLHLHLTCPTFPHAPSQTTAESHWETLLASSTATDQRLIITAAMKGIALQWLSFAL